MLQMAMRAVKPAPPDAKIPVRPAT